MDNIYSIDFNKQDDFPHEKWIIAGIKILRENNINHVNIDELCSQMNANVDQFKQYFSTLENFFCNLLEYWYEKETLFFLEAIEDLGGCAHDNLINLITLIHHSDKADEIAIRNWALKSDKAYKTLAKVDRARIDICKNLLKDIGFSEKESKLKAKFLYTSTVGIEYSSVHLTLNEKLEFVGLLINKN